MGRFRACLKGVFDLTGSIEGASLKNPPMKPWEDNVVFNTARVGGKVGQEVLMWIRPLHKESMTTDGGRKAVELLEDGYSQYRELMGGDHLPKEAFRLVDPTGAFLEAGENVEDVFRADSVKRVDAFFEGKMNAAGLQGIEQDFVKVKSFMVDSLEKAKQFSPDPTLYPRKPFTMDSDIKTPLIKLVQKTQDVDTLPYDMTSMYSKKMYVRLMKAPTGDVVPFHEWFGFVYPQLTKQRVFNPRLKRIAEILPEMSPAERHRISGVSNRLAGKKTSVQRVVDDVMDWARKDSGLESLDYSPSAKYALGMSRAFYRGIMWANPGMALVNLTQAINVAAKAGVLRTLDGLMNYVSKEGKELVTRHETALFGEFHKIFTQQKGILAKLDPTMVGFGFFNRAEYFNRGLGFHAGLSEFMSKHGMKNLGDFLALDKVNQDLYDTGIRHAMDMANDTQFLYSVVHQSPFLTGPYSKLFLGQLMTYPINQTEFLWRNMGRENMWFLPRWLAMTGAVSWGAYAGAGVVFKGLGGASMMPLAKDLWDEGYQSEAIWTGGWGALNFLPIEPFAWERGLTPANGMVTDTLKTLWSINKGDEAEITKNMSSLGRSWGALLPGFVSARRLAEGAYAQIYNEGKKFEPGAEGAGRIGSALEATGFIPLFNKTLNRYLGGGIPMLPDTISGRYSHEETGGETFRTAIGLRAKEAELRTKRQSGLVEEMYDFRGDRAIFADQAVQAMEGKDPAQLQALVQAAIKQGLITDPKDLKSLLTYAMKARTMTKEERLQKRIPQALKLQKLRKSMEEGE